MRHHLLAAAVLLAAASAAQAQVYRCGNQPVYTDKPCTGAAPVDLRANIVDPGPRATPGQREVVTPSAAHIAPDSTPKGGAAAPGTPGTVWDRRDARESENRSRTAPFTPGMVTSPP